MKIERKWVFPTKGHVYDVYIRENGSVLAVNENALLALEEGRADVLYTSTAGLTCVRPYSGNLLIGSEARKVLILGDEVKEIPLDYGVNSCAVKGEEVAIGLCCNGMALMKDGKVAWHLETDNHIYSVDWYEDVILGAGFDGFLYAVNREGKVLHKLPLAENVNRVKVCGDLIAVGTFEPGQLYVLRYGETGFQMVWGKRDFFDVRALSWSDNCKYLFVLDWNGTAEVYDSRGNLLLRGMGPRSMESSYWRNSEIAVGGWGRIELYQFSESNNPL
ncbi:hypothetical protein EYM_01555 [Ignicoccus islandicus DSM 13165]|uniref:Anaphase-promoting complex subunit 4 WD40 domain-containing protein n=1 Tax=Ignicoccus islandicus DSM 13165 TaxID=940295 RepID=A0A0U3G1L8_9CREN|nr:hypothetical protein [Ignicoccus islandicus]ALU12220.1 hypothetical protein EYM_01555 [Ignicoccus islandicus DSM 13165]